MTRDVIVVGAGPAGIAAAIWARMLRLDSVVLERSGSPGGQLHRVYNRVADYPGIDAADGAAIASQFAAHLARLDIQIEPGQRVVRVDAAAGVVETEQRVYEARYIVFAAGIRPRKLGISGEAELVGRGVSPSASRYASEFAGRNVLVVGGGDAAFEEALILSGVCRGVTLVHRSDRYTARPDFRRRVAEAPNITLMADTCLTAIEGSDRVEGARISRAGGESLLDVQGVFICAGIEPNTELLGGQVSLDPRGFVVADAVQRSSCDRLYAAGDVCSRSSLTIAGATGQGAAAIKDVQRRIARGE